MRRTVWILVVSLMWMAAGCDRLGTQGGAADLLPQVPNTNIIEGQTISQYISSLAEGSALLQQNPVLAGAIRFAEQAATCYQSIGAVALRIYSDSVFPLSSGLVTIVDRNAITDPANFARCLGGDQQGFTAQMALQVCTHTYTLKKDNNEFYIAYIGTTLEMCQAFCSQLEGCAANQP